MPLNHANVSPHLKQKFIRAPESLTLLDPQRQRNLGKIHFETEMLHDFPECKNFIII